MPEGPSTLTVLAILKVDVLLILGSPALKTLKGLSSLTYSNVEGWCAANLGQPTLNDLKTLIADRIEQSKVDVLQIWGTPDAQCSKAPR